MTDFFRGREIPISKKTYANFNTWIDKQNTKLAAQFEAEQADASAADSQKNVDPPTINPYAVRAVLDALWYAFGHTITPDQPCKS